ncbi:MAG TPA: hypothetical protein P5061_02075 [Mycobacterium sp.]|nr:hypothetical protein [Mycobacterium sp.]
MANFEFSNDSYAEHVHRVEAALEWARSKNIDTRTEFGRVVRGWVLWPPERRADQRRVLDYRWASQASTAGREGRFVYLWGIPCAGKTTFRQDPEHGLTEGFVVVDPDEIAELMVTSNLGIPKGAMSPMETVPLVYEEAWEIAHRLMLASIRFGRNVLMEMAVPAGWKPSHDDADPLVHTVFIEASVKTAEERMVRRHRSYEEQFRNGHWWGATLLPSGVLESFEEPEPSSKSPAGESNGNGSQQDSIRSLAERYEHDRDLQALTDGVLGRWDARSGVVEKPADWAEIYHRSARFPEDDDLIWLSVAEDNGVLTVDQVNGIFTTLLAAAARDEGPADE